jgi:hypothetical protein
VDRSIGSQVRDEPRDVTAWRQRRALLAAALVAAYLTCVAAPAIAAEPARPSDDFVDSVGVNLHLGYEGTVYDSAFERVVEPALIASGIRHVRDGVYTAPGAGAHDFFYQRCRALAAAGIRFNLITAMKTIRSDPTDYARLPDVYQWCDGAVEAFEGVNEPDLQAIPDGYPDWRTQTIESQRALYQAVKGSSLISGLAVLGPSIVRSPAEVGDLSRYLDYGNWHPYPGGECPACGDVYGQSLDTYLPAYRNPSGAKPMILTETGYHNAIRAPAGGHRPVSERAAGRYIPRLALEHFNRGFRRSYLYELIDLAPDPGQASIEANFGLLRNDGTPKPAYRALSSLLQLLSDPGPAFEPGALEYSLRGASNDVHHTLLRKRDGRWFLVLWLERSSYDTGARPNAPDDINARRDLPMADRQVTLKFGASIGAATIHRLDDAGTLSSSATPISRGEVDVAVSDRVTVAELRPAAAAVHDPPRLDRVRIVPRRVVPRRGRAGSGHRPAQRGARFRYRLSKPATVTIAIERRLPGRRIGRAGHRRCVAARGRIRKSRRCLRSRRVGMLSVSERAGRRSTRFSGRFRGRNLARGRYRARLRAVDSSGSPSRTRSVAFRLIRR